MPNDFDREYEARHRRQSLLEQLQAEKALAADAPAPVEEPAAPEAPSEAPDQPAGSAFGRGARGVKQGVALGTATALDSAMLAAQNLAAGILGPGVQVLPEEGVAEPALREELGPAEGTAGEVGEAIGRGVSMLVPATKALKAAGVANKFARSIGAGSVSAGLAYGPQDDSASAALVEMGGLADNPLTRALATSPTDTRWERAAKHAAEDATIGLVFEGVTAMARIRTAGKSAVDVGDPTDTIDSVTDAGAKVIAARGEVDRILQAADEIAKVTEGDETARQLRIASRRDGLDASALQIPALQDKIRAAVKLGDEVIVADNPTDIHINVMEKLAHARGLTHADELGDDVWDAAESGFVDLSGEIAEDGAIEAASFLTRDQAQQLANEALAGAVELGEDVAPHVRELGETGLEGAMREAEQGLARAERDLLDTVMNNGVDPRVAERARQVIEAATPERLKHEAAGLNQALGEYATRAEQVRQAAKGVGREALAAPSTSVFNNQLQATTEQAAALHSAMQEGALRGSVEGPSNVLAEVFDSTNFDRIAETGEVKELIAGMADQYGEMLNSLRQLDVESHAQTVEKATEFLKEDLRHFELGEGDLVGVIDGLVGGTHDLATKMFTLRTFETALAKKVAALADPETIRTNTMAAAEFLRYQTLLANVTDARAGVASQIGRALQAQRIGASARGFDDLLKLGDQNIDNAERMIAAAGGTDRVADLAAKFSNQGVDLNTARRLAQESDSRGRIVGNMLFENFVTSILSGPRTHLVNLAGNAAAAMWLANDALIDSAIVARAKRDPRFMKAAVSYGQGLMGGFRAAFKGIDGQPSPVMKALRTGQGTFGRSQFAGEMADRGLAISKDNFEQIAALSKHGGATQRLIRATLEAKGGLGGRLVDGAGQFLGWPLRALAAGDELAKTINYHGALYKDAFESAWDDVAARGGDVAVDMDAVLRRQAEIIDDVANVENIAKAAQRNAGDVALRRRLDQAVGLKRQAEDMAKLGTFTKDPGKLTKSIQMMRGRHPFLRFIMPFVSTPANILSFATVDRGPLGFMAREWSDDFKAGGLRRQRAMARHATGVALAGSAVTLAYNGNLVGSGPTEPSARQSWLADPRNVPYSIRVPTPDGSFVPLRFGRGDPVAIPFMMVADMAEYLGAMEDGQETSALVGMGIAFSEAVKDKSYLTGLSDAVRMFEDPHRYGQNWVVRLVSNMVPQSALLRQTGQIADDILPDVPEDSPILGTVAELFGADGMNSLPNLERNQGFVVQLVDNVSSNMPPVVGEPIRAAWNKVSEQRLSTERVPLLDMFGERIEYMPQVFRDPGPVDPIREEAARIGAFVSTRRSFGQITQNGKSIKLTPEQMNQWVKFTANPPGRRQTLRGALGKAMYGTEDPKPGSEFTNRWAGMTDEDRLSIANRIRESFRKAGRGEMLKRNPELAMQLQAALEARQNERRVKRDRIAKASEASDALGKNDLGGAMKNLPSLLRVLRDTQQGK